MKALKILLAISLVVASLMLHELGHFVVMRKHHIPCKVLSLGFSFPIYLEFPNIIEGTSVRVTPLLLGAYVGSEPIDNFPYKTQAEIFAAGPLVNLVFAMFLFLIHISIKRDFKNIGPSAYTILGMILLCCIFPKIYAWFLFIPLGCGFILFIVWNTFRKSSEGFVGPMGIVQVVRKDSSSFLGAVFIAGTISFSLGLINALPLFPLDGGKALSALLGSINGEVQLYYQRGTSLFLTLLLSYVLLSDLFKKNQ